MAVVVKHANDIEKSMERKRNIVSDTRENLSRIHNQGDESQSFSSEHMVISIDGSISQNTCGYQLRTKKRSLDRHGVAHPQSRKSDRGRSILDVSEEFLPACSDEEVVGIITMEDLMEELLQEEILDETDEYVEVHNKIKINMLTSSRAAGVAYLSQFSRQTSMVSQISRGRNSSAVSPDTSFTEAPGSTATISISPLKPVQSSTAEGAR